MFNQKLKKRIEELEEKNSELLELCKMQTRNMAKAVENLEMHNQRLQVLEGRK